MIYSTCLSAPKPTSRRRHLEFSPKFVSAAASAVVTLFLPINVHSAASLIDADAHWPQWRGPKFNGYAPQANPPTEWSETKNIQWKVKIPGSGHASPIIWGNRIFVLTAIKTETKNEAASSTAPTASPQSPATASAPGNPSQPADGDGGQRRRGGQGGPGGGRGGGRGGMSEPPPTSPVRFVVLCLDRATGKTVWEQTATNTIPHEGHHPDHGYASASPVTDGEHLFAFFGSRGLYCYTVDGKPVWSQNLGTMRTRAGFGEGASPAVHGDILVLNWDHEGDDFIAAFNKRTGKELWRQKREEATTWTTPLIVTHNGKPQVVVTATTKTRSYDLVTGEPIWECGGMTQNVIPTPVAADGFVYAISGFRGASLQAIQLGRTGDLTGTDAIAWKHDKSTPYVPSPALLGDHLYFVSGNNGLISCLDRKTGKPLYEAERLDAVRGVYASITGSNDRVYVVSRQGTTVVLKDSGKFEILATNTLDEGIDASPAIAGNQLFLRGQSSLYCIASP